MTLSTASPSAGLPQQSVADYLVTSIKPNIERIKTKIAGMKFEQRAYNLFSYKDEELSDISKYVKQERASLVSSLPHIPRWFSVEEYAASYAKLVDDLMQSDPQLRKALGTIRKKNDLADSEVAESISEAFEILVQKAMDIYRANAELQVYLMLQSRVPNNYFFLVDEARRASILEMAILMFKSKRLESELRLVYKRSFNLFRQRAETFRNEMSPLIVAGRVVSDLVSRSTLYLDICNSTSMKEMWKLKPYTMENVDKKYFDGLMADLRLQMRRLNEEIVAAQEATTLTYKNLRPYRVFALSPETEDFQQAIALTVFE
jgi:hypothetical protein